MLPRRLPTSEICRRKGKRECELLNSAKYFANMTEEIILKHIWKMVSFQQTCNISLSFLCE